ncbi:hypothetical protein [Brevibacillus sp. SYSU BS000544]|uniref:hypothetical protein n=1 Tax=Brevibacillus sp. SYSU BS000544 TaxID=3416443 RepID=UPI003CE46D8C
MKELIRFFLEILRIIIFLCVGSAVLFFIENTVWEWIGIDGNNVDFLLPALANLIFLFVFYRNYLQANGWYSSKKNQPLGIRLTVILVLIASILLISATFVTLNY